MTRRQQTRFLILTQGEIGERVPVLELNLFSLPFGLWVLILGP
jgi:hypothetical protein